MHLDGKGSRFGLTFPLTGGRVAKTGQVLLPNGGLSRKRILREVTWTGVVNQNFEMHLSLAAEALDIRQKVPLVGTYGAAKTIVILEGGGEAEGKHGGELEAVGDDAGVIASGLLSFASEPGAVRCAVFGDNYGKIAGGKEEGLVTEEAGDSGEGHRTAVAGKIRKGLAFCYAVCVPRHVSLQSTLMGLVAQSRVG